MLKAGLSWRRRLAVLATTTFGFAAGFLGTLIGTGGNLDAALQNGLISGIVAGVTFGLLHIDGVYDAVQSISGWVSGQLSAFGNASQQFAQNFVTGLFDTTVSDATTIGLDQAFYGHSMTGGAFLQSIGLFALTAVASFTIAHLPILDQFWNSGGVQLVQGDQSTTATLQNELLKPVLEGGAAYGIGDLLGVKDSEALGIGTAVGSFAAPWITAGVDSFYDGQLPQGVSIAIRPEWPLAQRVQWQMSELALMVFHKLQSTRLMARRSSNRG